MVDGNNFYMVFAYFSSSLLYASLVWFALVGYLAHLCVVMLLIRLSAAQVVAPLMRFHAISLGISYLVAPVLTAFSCAVFKVLYGAVAMDLPAHMLYFSVALSMMLCSTYFFCSFFASVSCKKVQQVLFFADGLLTIIGYFVLLAFPGLWTN